MTVDTSYRYDEVGELVESLDGSRGRTTYRYDRIGQLLAMVPEKARAEPLKYDPAGNLAEADEGAEVRVYGPGNRLLRKGDTEYRWDGDGRLIEKRTRRADGTEEVWRYWWDGAGLLKMVERPDGLRCEFGYDPFARRVTKKVTTAGATRAERVRASDTRFVWDGDVLAHDFAAPATNTGTFDVAERTYCFEDGGFAPVAHRETGGWFHYVNDPVGTPERLVEDDGALAYDRQRTAWGDTREESTNSAATPIRFQGQYHDQDVCLCFNCFRACDADSALFVTPDPLGISAGLNHYGAPPSYLRWIDPLGLTNSPTSYPNPDPPMSDPPVRYEPTSTEEIERMRAGLGPRTRANSGTSNTEAHHRQQVPISEGGVMDELTQQTHRGAGAHTRHCEPSRLTRSQRQEEIREHWKKRGKEYVLPGEGI